MGLGGVVNISMGNSGWRNEVGGDSGYDGTGEIWYRDKCELCVVCVSICP